MTNPQADSIAAEIYATLSNPSLRDIVRAMGTHGVPREMRWPVQVRMNGLAACESAARRAEARSAK